MADLMTLEDFESRKVEVETRIAQINADNAGRRMADHDRNEWNELNAEREELVGTIAELRAREERVAEIVGGKAEGAQERGFHTPHVRKSGVARGNDVYDLSTVTSTFDNPARANAELVERAKRSLEDSSIPHYGVDEAKAKGHIDGLLRAGEEFGAVESSAVALRMLATGSPEYKRAFAKMLAQRPMNAAETAAAERAFTIGSTGNYPVPFTLDPTLVPISNGTVNPLRQVSKVITITGNTWKGVNNAGITAAYAAEGTEASDNTPTLTQPTFNVERAQAFIPFSIETQQDWAGMQGELAAALADAKDELEGTQFVTGAGHGSTAPQGIITGATTTVDTATSGTLAVGDLYNLLKALPPRFRANARFGGNIGIYNLIRQLDNNGGADLWKYLGDGVGERADGNASVLLGKPAHELSAMDSDATAENQLLVFGDFRYFQIVDRIGMDIELIPHLLGSNRRPTGQRGIYAIWRNTAGVLSANAFRVLVSKAA